MINCKKEKRWSNKRNTNTNSYGTLRPTLPQTPTSETQSPVPHKLIWEELKQKRSLGLCFSCDEQYSPGHKCKQPQLFIMEGENDDDSDTYDHNEEASTSKIMLNALNGWDSPTMIRLHASIKHKSLLALVDSGSTHNFISENVAQGPRLSETPTKTFTVRVANRNLLRCRRKYTGIVIGIDGTQFTITLYALPLSGLDLVLGVHWLASLGLVLCDWTAKTLQFTWNAKPTTLTRLSPHAIKPTTQHDIDKKGRQGQMLFAIFSVIDTPELKSLNDDMCVILQYFDDIFRVPDSFPLNDRSNTISINVRPYRSDISRKTRLKGKPAT